MKKQEPRKSDLHLDALYPEMPASFSQRIDEALFQARSSRTYGKRWSSRNRRGVMAACACAAAFVAVCGAVLFLPSLRAQREARACDTNAAGPELPPATIVITTAVPSAGLPDAVPTPTPEAEPSTEQNAGTELMLPQPTSETKAPAATPLQKPVQEKDKVSASDVTDAMVEKCAAQLLEWYCCALDKRTVPDTSALMETNVDTELWYYALELQIEQMTRAGSAVEVSELQENSVLLEMCDWQSDDTFLATVRFRYEEAGEIRDERAFLLFRVTGTGLRIIGFDCEGGSVWYDALKAAAEAYMDDGLEQADANVLAYSTLSSQLHSDMLVEWSGGALYPLLSAEESDARIALPWRPASDLTNREQSDWFTDDLKDAALVDLLVTGSVPILPQTAMAMFLEYGVRGLGITVQQDSYVVYLCNAGLMAEACRGTLDEVRTAFASLPTGVYLVTFRAVLPVEKPLAELGSASGAGAVPAEPEAAEEWLFAFAMQY